jgi:hypothetical protein
MSRTLRPSSTAYATVGVAYQAGPSGRSPFGVNGLNSRLASRTIVVDRGKIYLSQGFVAACETLGVSVRPVRHALPDGALHYRTMQGHPVDRETVVD